MIPLATALLPTSLLAPNQTEETDKQAKIRQGRVFWPLRRIEQVCPRKVGLETRQTEIPIQNEGKGSTGRLEISGNFALGMPLNGDKLT